MGKSRREINKQTLNYLESLSDFYKKIPYSELAVMPKKITLPSSPDFPNLKFEVTVLHLPLKELEITVGYWQRRFLLFSTGHGVVFWIKPNGSIETTQDSPDYHEGPD
jgi:hypothetical protein